MRLFEKTKQKEEVISNLKSYVLKKVPKKGIKKIDESKKEFRIHFNRGYDVSDDDFTKLANYASTFPNDKYDKIKKVIIGQTSNFDIYFKIEFK